MIGKILRQDELHPGLSALKFAHKIIKSTKVRGRKGRHRINLYDTIKMDIKNAGLNFETSDDMARAIELAKDEKKWNSFRKEC